MGFLQRKRDDTFYKEMIAKASILWEISTPELLKETRTNPQADAKLKEEYEARLGAKCEDPAEWGAIKWAVILINSEVGKAILAHDNGQR